MCAWCVLEAPAHGSLEAASGRPGGPAIEGAGAVDQLTDGDEGGGQVEVEVDHGAIPVGAAAEFAVVVHPRVQALDDPALARLDGGGDALAGDLPGEAERRQQGPGDVTVVPAIEVHRDGGGQRLHLRPHLV